MSKPTQLAVSPAAGRESARPVPGPLSARGPIPRGDRASGEEPRARVVRPAFGFREIPQHDSLSLACPACAGRARTCPCGGTVHVLLYENRSLCSTVGCDAWVGPIATVDYRGRYEARDRQRRPLAARNPSLGPDPEPGSDRRRAGGETTLRGHSPANEAATGHAGGLA